VTERRIVTAEAVSTGKAAPIRSKSGMSGIDKQPRSGGVMVSRLGLDGDAIVDTDNHGGFDQAVYCYCRADYDWWEAELGKPLRPGAFGENVTLTGISSADAAVGDRLTCGSLVLEVTSPRIPCETFAAHMDDRLFVKRFFKANRTGFYCRVISEGPVGAGDVFEYTPFGGPRVPMTELVELYGARDLDPQTVARFRAAPVHGELAALLAQKYPSL
jgi:MOSC domain-containing protein YiiM